MRKIRLLPYHRASKSARLLAEKLGVLMVTEQQVRKHGDFDIIINYGHRGQRRFTGDYFNKPECVNVASNKLASYRAFKEAGVPCPDWTTDKDRGLQWWEDNVVVVARRLLRGNKGHGIVLCSREGNVPLVDAPLYTKYIKKADEYRVHILDGKVFDVQQKRKRKAVAKEDMDYQVRNERNGWVFCRGGVDAPDCVLRASLLAVASLGLDFGGVDVGYNRRADAATVYEVNTAPGIEGSTVEGLAEALREAIPELRGPAYARRAAQ